MAALMAAAVAAAAAAQPVGPKLTPKLNQLLTEEMQSVLQASTQIVTALVAGDHTTVARLAQQIHDSFILQRKLTEQDRKDLMRAVPPEFVELDGTFHGVAQKLAQAARQKDPDLEIHYFGRMLELCHRCHSRFATDKFPALGGTPTGAYGH